MFGKIESQALSQALEAVPADIWRGSPIPGSGRNFYRYVFPSVMVEHYTKAQFAKLAAKIGSAVDDNNLTSKLPVAADDKTKELPKDMDTQDFLNFINHYTADNTATLYLTGILTTLYSSGLNFSVRRIEQVGPLLYIQVMLTFEDVKVNNIDYSSYYIIREFFMITRGNDLFGITTLLPTENPAVANSSSVAINEWLTSFRLAAF
jgi:hypothetical protein